MGADDDADCVEHVWVLAEIGESHGQLDMASVCQRCGAVDYEPGQAALGDRRPPL